MTEDEKVGWHHRLDGHEYEQTPGDGERPGILGCCRTVVCMGKQRVGHNLATEQQQYNEK